MKLRQFVCTIWPKMKNPLEALPLWSEFTFIKRVTYQLEKGEVTGRAHWQVFIELKGKMVASNVARHFRSKGYEVHVAEPKFVLRNGIWKCPHPKAGRAYCKKLDCIDGHRYEWLAGKSQPEVTKLRLAERRMLMTWELFDSGNTKERLMECLRQDIEYIKVGLKVKVG